MADEAKATIQKLIKLHETLLELQLKEQAIVDEMGKLLSGGPGIGALLKRLETHFSECWQVRYRGPYAFTFIKDRPQMKRLIGLVGVEELENRMLRYMRNDDPFFVRTRHSFGAFVTSVNQHAAPESSAPADLSLDQDVADTKAQMGELERRRQQAKA